MWGVCCLRRGRGRVVVCCCGWVVIMGVLLSCPPAHREREPAASHCFPVTKTHHTNNDNETTPPTIETAATLPKHPPTNKYHTHLRDVGLERVQETLLLRLVGAGVDRNGGGAGGRRLGWDFGVEGPWLFCWCCWWFFVVVCVGVGLSQWGNGRYHHHVLFGCWWWCCWFSFCCVWV